MLHEAPTGGRQQGRLRGHVQGAHPFTHNKLLGCLFLTAKPICLPSAYYAQVKAAVQQDVVAALPHVQHTRSYRAASTVCWFSRLVAHPTGGPANEAGNAHQRQLYVRAALWLLNDLPAALERTLGLNDSSAQSNALSATDRAWLAAMVQGSELDPAPVTQRPPLSGTSGTLKENGESLGDGYRHFLLSKRCLT